MERWLTAAEVATRLGIGADLVARYCREGRLEAERTAAGWLIEPTSVATFAEARRRARSPVEPRSTAGGPGPERGA